MVSRTTDWGSGAPSHGTIRLQPLDRERIEAKFRNMAMTVLPATRVDALIEAVAHLESMSDVRALVQLTRPG